MNTVGKGDYIVVLSETGDVLLPAQAFPEIGLVNLPDEMTVSDGYVSLMSLSPEVRYGIDEQQATLEITASPELFAKQNIPYEEEPDRDVLRTDANTFYLTYALDHTRGNELQYQTLVVRTELAARIAGWLAFSDFQFDPDEDSHPFVRRLTSLVRDDVAHLRRYTFGDVYGTSGEGGSGLALGGLSLTKVFAMSPYIVTYPGPVVAGMVRTPSKVEVYINDTLITEKTLMPGPFEFLDLPLSTGASTVVLVITDAFGREERIPLSSYLSALVLKPGFHEYSYAAGFRRLKLGESSFDYGEPCFLGFHRVGLARSFTGGLRLEADPHTINGGPMAAFTLGCLGELNLALAASGSDSGFGYGGSGRYFYAGKSFSSSLEVSGYSPGYATLSQAASQDSPLLQSRLALGIQLKALGSFSTALSYNLTQGGAEGQSLTFSYSRGLASWAQLRASVKAQRGQEDKVEGYVAVDMVPQKRRVVTNLEYRYDPGCSTATARVLKSAPKGVGLGFDLEAATEFTHASEIREQSDIQVDAAAMLQLNAPWALYSADWIRSSGISMYRLSTAGSIVAVDRSVHLSRPVSHGFALVKIGDSPGVRVEQNGEQIGRTHRNGKLLVPGLIPYFENRLSVETLDLPLNREIGNTELYYAPPYCGGAPVEFPIKKIQGLMGRLYWLENEQRVPAEMAAVCLQINGTEVESVVGFGGEFYLENIPAGRYTGRIRQEGREGIFELWIPDSDQVLVDLGDIDCREPAAQ